MTFNGFISYSHAADGRLAPAVQRGLHRLAKPWNRRRALWIFRDQTGLAVTPRLWSSIQTALDGSEYFVLLASPEAAGSPWVNREIEHWIATKSADRILPVVTDGEWAWDAGRGDFTADSTAVPPALRGVFTEEPFFLDLRWARGSEHLSLQHSRFRDAIAQLAAPMHGVSTDELEGEDVRQHRRARRMRSGAVVTLVVLAMLASLTGVSAVRNSERAKASLAEALRQQQEANGQRDLAAQAAEEARRQEELAQQQQNRAALAAAEADESERLAREQRKLADQAAAEARRQQRLADQAATRTRHQQQLARAAAERAEREKKEAARLARIAAEQRRLADEAAKEAGKQQAKADEQQRIAVSRRLMNQAGATIVDDPKTALMLGAAAQELNPDTVTRRQLTGVVTSTNYASTISDVASAKYTPDGVLVTRGTDGRVSLWNVTDPRRPARLATLQGTGAAGENLALSPDGRTLAIAGADRTTALWDIADRSRPVPLGTLRTGSPVVVIAFSGDGISVVTGEASGVVTLWDTTDRTRPAPLWTRGEPSNRPVQNLAISPNGRLLIVRTLGIASGEYDQTDRADPVSLAISIGGAGAMAFSPDGSRLAVGVDGRVWLHDMTRVGPRRTARNVPSADPPAPPPPLPSEEPDPEDTGGSYDPTLTGLSAQINSVAFSSDANLVVAGDQYGTAMVWDRRSASTTNRSRFFTSVQAAGPISEVSLDPDAEKLVTVDSSGTATLWNVTPPGAPDSLATLDGPHGRHQTTIFSPDGRSLVSAGSDGTASTWDTADPARPVRGADLALYGGEVQEVAFSPDRRTVATVATSGKLTVADASRPAQRTTLTTLPEKVWGPVVFSPDGRTLAVVTYSTTLMLWDVADPARPALLAELGGAVFGYGLAFSPDGRTLATSGADAKITLWNVANRSAPARFATLTGHSASVDVVTFSPNGRYLASGSDDHRVFLWDVSDRVRPLRLATLAAHDNNRVISVAFSPDGRTLATGDVNATMVLWDATDPAGPIQLARLIGVPYGQVRTLAFRRDGRTLAVAGQYIRERATVTLWSYQRLNGLRADPARSACAITGRGLTPAEWARFIPEIRYRNTCRK